VIRRRWVAVARAANGQPVDRQAFFTRWGAHRYCRRVGCGPMLGAYAIPLWSYDVERAA